MTERKENVVAVCGLRCPQDSGRTKEDQAILWVVITFNGGQELSLPKPEERLSAWYQGFLEARRHGLKLSSSSRVSSMGKDWRRESQKPRGPRGAVGFTGSSEVRVGEESRKGCNRPVGPQEAAGLQS